MNWEEFRTYIDTPIDGVHNKGTQIANMAWLLYQTHLNNEILQKQVLTLEEELDRMKTVINDIRSEITEMRTNNATSNI